MNTTLLYKRIISDNHRDKLESKEEIICRSATKLLPSTLLGNRDDLIASMKLRAEKLKNYKNGLCDSLDLDLKVSQKHLPIDLKTIHTKLIETYNFEDFEKKQQREQRRLYYKNKLGRFA